MEKNDRRLLPIPLGGLVALLVMIVVGTAVRFPNGAYDMTGLWTIALSGAGSWVAATFLLALLLRPHKRT